MTLYSVCVGCKTKIPYRTKRCEECQRKYNKLRENRRDKDKAALYTSYSWRKLREQVLKDNNYMCAKCKAEGVVTEAIEVHHVIPVALRWDLRYEYNNLMCLCDKCHDDIHK